MVSKSRISLRIEFIFRHLFPLPEDVLLGIVHTYLRLMGACVRNSQPSIQNRRVVYLRKPSHLGVRRDLDICPIEVFE